MATFSVGTSLVLLPKVVLASASPARLKLLQNVGIEPLVIVSAVDEDEVANSRGWQTPHDLAQGLAIAKAEKVAAEVGPGHLVIGCDSVMEHNGIAYGKPGSVEIARERLAALSGSSGHLYTGHHLIEVSSTGTRATSALARTQVEFQELTAAEIEAYIATGEPLQVAGSYTLDSLGGPFIRSITGDAANVVGLSVTSLRLMLAELGYGWELILSKK